MAASGLHSIIVRRASAKASELEVEEGTEALLGLATPHKSGRGHRKRMLDGYDGYRAALSCGHSWRAFNVGSGLIRRRPRRRIIVCTGTVVALPRPRPSESVLRTIQYSRRSGSDAADSLLSASGFQA